MKVLLSFDTHLLAEGIVKQLLQLSGDLQYNLAAPGTITPVQVVSADYDLLLVDADSMASDVISLLYSIKKNRPSTKVIFVCSRLDNDLLKAYRNGLDGAFLKSDNADMVLAALSSVLDGKVHVPQSIIMNILYEGFVFTGFDYRLNLLSRREMIVLEKISDGHSMKEAARQLKLSASTLSTHKQRIKKKLGLSSGQEFNNFIRAFAHLQKSPAKFGEASM
ncbi:MAG: LuxR C-terminal-related transcriptional regulator [Sphingomonadales bacterium]